MVYIDADGVLADYEGWAVTINPESLKSREVMYRDVIASHYKECFLMSKPLNNMFMQMVAIDPEYFVLSALPSYEDLKKYTDLSSEEIVNLLAVLKENKFEWFEEQGVPRCKVIITSNRTEKFKYCYMGDVLYDDYQDTVDEWNSLGGVGILAHQGNC